MANFVFKRTEQKSMKIAGLLNSSTMIINVDGEEILVTKDRWEEEIELDTVFFHPFKINKPKELKIK